MSALTQQYQPYQQDSTRRRITPITKRQKAVLSFIESHIEQYSFAPSHGDICKHLDLKSRRSAAVYLRELEAKGFIETIHGASRAIRVVSDSERIDRRQDMRLSHIAKPYRSAVYEQSNKKL